MSYDVCDWICNTFVSHREAVGSVLLFVFYNVLSFRKDQIIAHLPVTLLVNLTGTKLLVAYESLVGNIPGVKKKQI